jgi:hypothetical protein
MDRFLLWEMSQIRRRELLELAGAVRPKGGHRSPGVVSAAFTRGFGAITSTVSRGIAMALLRKGRELSLGLATVAACRPAAVGDRPGVRSL